MGNRKVTSICDLWYQRLDGKADISHGWQKVSVECQGMWLPMLRPEPTTRRLLYLVLAQPVQVGRRYGTIWIYRGSSVLMCGCKFHFCCGTAVSYIRVTRAFSCYGFHFIYMHVQVRFMQTAEGYSFSRIMYVALTVAGAGYMSPSGRSCDRPSRHRFCLVSLCLPVSECWDGSLYSKLLLHASHTAHQDQIKPPQIYVCYVWYVCKAATGRQSNCSK